jgi:putative ABC transport system permease protein
MRYYTGNDFLRTLYVQADAPHDVVRVTGQVAEVLSSRHRLGAQYNVQNLTGLLGAAHRISNALTFVLLGIALIALVISGVGIMNIMLVTVTERTREIGVRKAVGATRSEIQWQFLIEAFVISGAGAVVGILLGVSLPVGLQLVRPEIYVPISWISVVVSFTMSSLIGVLFGVLPARRAAALQPTEALHHE